MASRCTIGLCAICRESLLRKGPSILGSKTTATDFPIELLHKSPASLTKEQRIRRDKFLKLITSNSSGKNGISTSITNANLQSLYQQSVKESVVTTKCGHVFHKYCLKAYCQSFRQLRKRGLVECPICKHYIMMSGTIELELRILQRYNQATDGHYKLTEIMNAELKSQLDPLIAKNDCLLRTIEEQSEMLRALEQQSAKIRVKWSEKRLVYKEYKEVVRRLTRIEHEENVLQIENRNLTKIFLTLMTIGPMMPILFDPRIPQKLIPYFSAILQHPELYDPFREIIVPLLPNQNQAHLQPSGLVDGIIEIVRMRTNIHNNKENQEDVESLSYLSEPNSSVSSIASIIVPDHNINHNNHPYS